MARVRTLTNLIADVRARADMQNQTSFIPDAEITEYLNQSLAELYEMLVQARGADYYETTATITADGTNTSFALAGGFMSLLGVETTVNGSSPIPLSLYDRRQHAALTSAYAPTTGDAYCYRVRAGNIDLLPKPAAGKVFTVYYVPAQTRLSAGGDQFDGVSGWEEFAVVDAARKCATKEESWEVVGALTSERDRLIARIQNAAATRDAFSATKYTNMREAWGPRRRGLR